MPAQPASATSGMPPGRFRRPPPLPAATWPLAWPPPTTLNPIDRDRARPVRLPVPIIPRVNATAVSLRWIRANVLPTAAPLPEYPVSLHIVRPQPPSCILRIPHQSSDGTLEMIANGLPSSGRLQLQLRKVADSDLHTFRVGGGDVRIEGKRIFIERVWNHVWREYEKTAAFVRVIQDGQPLTSWSSSFMIAADAETCGHSQLAPNPTSMPAPTPIATLASAPTPPYESTPSARTFTPLATPAPTPNVTLASAPTPPYESTRSAKAHSSTVIPSATGAEPNAFAPKTGLIPNRLSFRLVAILSAAALLLVGLGFIAGRISAPR